MMQATEYHLGQLKAKLAKLRTTLQEPAKVNAQLHTCLRQCLSKCIENVK